MNRVIRNVAVSSAPAFFGNADTRFVDDEISELIDRARAEAYEQGRRDGDATARADMAATGRRLEAALAAAGTDAEARRAAVVTEALEAALAVTEFVTGTRPGTDPSALAARIQEAIATLDDETVVVHVHPGDWDAVSSLVQLPPTMRIERDTTLQPGEARLRGTWCSVEMTRAAALQIAREVLA